MLVSWWHFQEAWYFWHFDSQESLPMRDWCRGGGRAAVVATMSCNQLMSPVTLGHSPYHIVSLLSTFRIQWNVSTYPFRECTSVRGWRASTRTPLSELNYTCNLPMASVWFLWLVWHIVLKRYVPPYDRPFWVKMYCNIAIFYFLSYR